MGLELEPRRHEAAETLLDTGGEVVDGLAAIAGEVVVVSLVCELEPSRLAREVDRSREPCVDEAIEVPIHRRDTQLRHFATRGLEHFAGAKRSGRRA